MFIAFFHFMYWQVSTPNYSQFRMVPYFLPIKTLKRIILSEHNHPWSYLEISQKDTFTSFKNITTIFLCFTYNNLRNVIFHYILWWFLVEIRKTHFSHVTPRTRAFSRLFVGIKFWQLRYAFLFPYLFMYSLFLHSSCRPFSSFWKK